MGFPTGSGSHPTQKLLCLSSVAESEKGLWLFMSSVHPLSFLLVAGNGCRYFIPTSWSDAVQCLLRRYLSHGRVNDPRSAGGSVSGFSQCRIFSLQQLTPMITPGPCHLFSPGCPSSLHSIPMVFVPNKDSWLQVQMY